MKNLSQALSAAIIAAFLFTPITVISAEEETPVAAKDEPRHRPKLENDVVRVLDVEIPPSYRTLYHTHSVDYAYLMINSVQLKNEIPGQDKSDVQVKAGDVGYYRSSRGAYTHRFTNVSDAMFRAIGIELMRGSGTGVVATPLAQSTGYVTVLDTERVRAYRLTLEPGQSAPSVTIAGPSVRVYGGSGKLNDARGANRVSIDAESAMFEFREGETTTQMTNVGSQRIDIYEFEIK